MSHFIAPELCFSRFDCSENVAVAVDSYSGDFSMWLVSTAAGLVGDL